MDILASFASLTGMILGTAGFTLSLSNYLRDRPQIKCSLQWNMVDSSTKKVCGVVTASNVGRRPIYLGGAALEVEGDEEHLVLLDAARGAKLSEGDAPARFMVNHDGMAQYADRWRRIRAYVEDSTGKRYYSRFPNKQEKPPHWAV